MILARLLPCAFAVLLVAQSPLNATPKHHAAKDHETKDNPVLELTPDTVITRVKYAPDKPPLELTLQQFIKKYNIPGISMAVIDNYKVVWAKGFGVAVAGGTEPVTTTTLFRPVPFQSRLPRQARSGWWNMASCHWMKTSTRS